MGGISHKTVTASTVSQTVSQSAPTYSAQSNETSTTSRDIPGLTKPKPVESNVKEREINIPPFLQRRK